MCCCILQHLMDNGQMEMSLSTNHRMTTSYIQALAHSHPVELPLTQLKTVQVKGQGLKSEKIHLPYIVYLHVHIMLLDTWLHTCLQ